MKKTAAGRYRLLVSAYACNPFKGSEEGVGWNWVKAIAAYHDLWVITAAFHREDIEKEVRKQPDEYAGIQFLYVNHKRWHYWPTRFWKFIERSWFKPLMNRVYREWQKDAFRLGAQLHKKIQFDLIHQLTYVGFRFPGHLWKLDIPFVWGPIGGLENTPIHFFSELGFNGALYYLGRNSINSLHKRFLLSPKRAMKKARAIISATTGIQKEIKKWYGVESEVICEIGPPKESAADVSIRNPEEPLQVSWSGQHLPGKALPLLLKALKHLPDFVKYNLDILGDGPCTKKWQHIADAMNIQASCRWHGQVLRPDAIRIIQRSHVFVITSLKDLTSTVLLEALSRGVPVIALDHCGFSDVVTPECGIKIPATRPRQIIRDIAESMTFLWKNEPIRRRMAKGALKRAQDFSWDKKAEKINNIYLNAIAAKST